jgi:two-component system nitrogen regulation response regulator GlnG
LQKQGFDVDVAKDGEEAKRKTENSTYDAALISFILPDMYGIDLLLFTAKTMPNAAKIVTTGFPNLRNGIKAFEAGADAYFCKPVKPEELIRVVNEKMLMQEKESKKPNANDSSSGTSSSYGSGSGRKNLLNGVC